MDQTMTMVAICELFHWTYDDYMNQPQWFITLIREKIIRDQKQRELEVKKIRHGRR